LIPVWEKGNDAINIDQIVEETEELIKSGIDKKEAFKMKAREYKIKKSTIYKHFLDI
jgi:16S rRNA (cytidine1402-2'-O)-methyltransferase